MVHIYDSLSLCMCYIGPKNYGPNDPDTTWIPSTMNRPPPALIHTQNIRGRVII